MNSSFCVTLFLCAALSALSQAPLDLNKVQKIKVHIGSTAPDFELRDQGGQKIRLSDYRGKKVILAFFVLAFTPACGDELQALQAAMRAETTQRVKMIAISMDSVYSNREFANRLAITFPVLSDKEGRVTKKYGLLNRAMFASRRATFLINEKGLIEKIFLDHKALNPQRELADWVR